MQEMTGLRFAIIGCGRIAQRHAEHIHSKGTLVAVCDVVREKADSLAMRFNTRPWYSIQDLLQYERDIDVITVCTPNGLHAEHSIKSMQAGFHVLCEKPMALTVQDAEAMIAVASQTHKQLVVVKQNRYNPPVVAVKKAIDEGRLGRIFSFQMNCFWNRGTDYYDNEWRGTLALDGGTLFTQFSHFVDLLYWMLGDVKQVKALLTNYAHSQIIEFEDTGVVLFELNTGATGALNYTVNSHRKNMEGSLTLFGEKGTVKIGGQYLNELEYQDIDGYRIEYLPLGNKANDYGNYEGSMSNHDKVYDNVIAVFQSNVPPTATAQDGLKTVEIIQKIYKAAIQV